MANNINEKELLEELYELTQKEGFVDSLRGVLTVEEELRYQEIVMIMIKNNIEIPFPIIW